MISLLLVFFFAIDWNAFFFTILEDKRITDNKCRFIPVHSVDEVVVSSSIETDNVNCYINALARPLPPSHTRLLCMKAINNYNKPSYLSFYLSYSNNDTQTYTDVNRQKCGVTLHYYTLLYIIPI